MSETRPEGKLPGLDGLRAIAVLLVMLYHQQVLRFGWVGVQIFFVLSGYLITRSLVRARSTPLRGYLTAFYGRRSLRIFPLYFTVLGLLGLALAARVQMGGVREGLPFAATYTYNFWHASQGFQHSKLISHFWSLCVEEQFYLVWPFVMYFCPRPRLRALLAAIVLAGPLVRIATVWVLRSPHVHALPETYTAVYVLTPSHVDAFATGAYLSLFPLGGARKATFVAATLLLVAGLAVVGFASRTDLGLEAHPELGTLGYPLGLAAAYGWVWGYSLLNVTSGLVIDCLVNGRLAPRVFDNAILKHIGKISYGFYVLHFPLQSFIAKALPVSLWQQIAIQTVATTVVATASFYWWESWFLSFKDRWFKL